MKLKSVRVENFKCIDDSEGFTAGPVTCLVGKNESGKTALLQALYRLNPVVPEAARFEDMEYPRRRWSEYKERRAEKPDNALNTTWELEADDWEALVGAIGPKAIRGVVTIMKGYDSKRRYAFELDEGAVIEHCMSKAELSPEERSAVGHHGTVADLLKALEGAENKSPGHIGLVNSLKSIFPEGRVRQAIINIVDSRLPKFVYFDEYYRLPGQVSVEQLIQKKSQAPPQLSNSDRVFLALLDLVGAKAEDLSSIPRFEPLIAELEAVSNRLSDEIFAYWTQNRHLQVEFRLDPGRPQDPAPFNTGNVFRTRIENTRHRVTVGFDERSAGFVWFFSFLVWFSQVRKVYGQNLVLLLDEPGLGLHARAQQDLLRYIKEKLQPRHQVIYTAHSPFMVDAENLLSARTVEDVVLEDGTISGTKVGDKVLSTDRDTIFPLQGALGFDITQTLFVGKHNLLVEGPSDLLYLKWFSRELESRRRVGLDKRWVIAPCGGLDKIASFVALFGGNKLNIAVLADFRRGDKRKVRELRESALLKEGRVFTAEMYTGGDEADVEDMIGRANYVALVNASYSLSGKHRLPDSPQPGKATRVVKEVEDHFATLPPEAPQFDHYGVAEYLTEHGSGIKSSLPELEAALGRFEQFFGDVNKLLP